MSHPQVDEVEKLINEIILDYRVSPINLLDINRTDAEYDYLIRHRNEYIRTVYDVMNWAESREFSSINVLEIGTFLGVVSVALSKLGFKVAATDIQEFMLNQKLQEKFSSSGVAYAACNLREYELPFSNELFDVVIMCEVLEHLNFNPLPVIKEINRVMTTHGLFYVALPNLARGMNRRKLLRGDSIHNPIKDYFAQLDPTDNMIIGLHWREYTAAELKELLEQMDFKVIRQLYGDSRVPVQDRSTITFKRMIKKVTRKFVRYILDLKLLQRLIYSAWFDPDLDPSLHKELIAFARKEQTCNRQFHFTDATLPK
jgi:2-polyprenyl-3-methyl-5-hydroxy-6-metoxy-1,4-benzoquinol methylase